MAIAVLLILSVALAVIGGYALRRHSRDQWGARVKTASHMVMDGVGLPRVDGHVPVREVDFEEMWATNAREGNAYLELPSVEPLETLVDKIDHQFRARSGAEDDEAQLTSSATRPDRPSVSTRFLKATSISAWKDRHEGARDRVDSERTVA